MGKTQPSLDGQVTAAVDRVVLDAEFWLLLVFLFAKAHR
jgi:hypothetical protein